MLRSDLLQEYQLTFFHMIMEVTELLETRNEAKSVPSLVQTDVLPQDCLWAHKEVLWTSWI